MRKPFFEYVNTLRNSQYLRYLSLKTIDHNEQGIRTRSANKTRGWLMGVTGEYFSIKGLKWDYWTDWCY